MSANEIDADSENDEVIDLNEVNMDECWERVELNIMSKAFFSSYTQIFKFKT